MTLHDILHAPLASSWGRFCNDYGFNEWCINEGLAESDTTVQITIEDAKFYGIID